MAELEEIMSGTGVNPAASGTAVLQLARTRVGERYVLGILVPKDNPNWKGPWDCSEFASWLVFQVAGILYGCENDAGPPATADAYTGYWARDADSLGEIVTIDQAASIAGALVLRNALPGSTGHVVVSDGTGGTVEAHSTADGVIVASLANRRWDMGILVPSIQYSAGSPVQVSPPQTVIYRLMVPLMTGDPVRQIQSALQAKGFDPGGVDGSFGPHTQAAVIGFQLVSGLVGDGEVGPITAAALGLQL
jgi:hypothetical protein